MGGLPLQLVAVFIAEDDAHPGRHDVVGAFGIGGLNVRRAGSTSFERLTGDLAVIKHPGLVGPSNTQRSELTNRNATPIVQHLQHV